MLGAKIVIGILAHVDAGKTTLSEALLYTTGTLRKLGRVDHKDAFLDNFALERERGITIFSKQANLAWRGKKLTLLDTPGHVDFSAEMERTLQVLDYCILVISGADGVQSHTATLWKLLKKNHIPTFLFINKMDQPAADREMLLRQIKTKLSGACVDFSAEADNPEEFTKNVAACSEALLEEYLESGSLRKDSIAGAVSKREVFPCYFGSALHLEGVNELLDGLEALTLSKEYPDTFGARVYKISRDRAGNRLTHLKVTGGMLKVKMTISNADSAASGEEVWTQKADSIRICAGAGFVNADHVKAGEICAIPGLTQTYAGQGLGFETRSEAPVLVPVLTYRLVLPEGVDIVKVLGQMRALEEEEPELNVVWRESLKEIHVQVMGEVQTQILKSLILERFGLDVEFADGRLLYQETIADSAEGIGHFEPLRHYAEVHLLLEPGEPGSGIELATDCDEDALDKNWQRLILTHLEEKTHLGVLTGSPVTDLKITLLAGRAHQKHTEGGDFRQATYRAVRQGLMQCQSVLLEPVFSFVLELPTENLGRAMTDIQKMHGSFDPPMTQDGSSILTGSAPVSEMKDYQREVISYTRGLGRLTCTLKGYEPCHNAEEVIAACAYDPETDTENPSSSVFCSHGTGFVVQWNEVSEYAHVQSEYALHNQQEMKAEGDGTQPLSTRRSSGRNDYITTEEIDEIFYRTYGKKQEEYAPYRYSKGQNGVMHGRAGDTAAEKPYQYKPVEKLDEYFLVDGYNIIFAWEELRALARINIDSARDRLIDICCNYQGVIGATLILVFDAYKVKGNPGSVQRHHNIYIVYTKEAETADQYIEKTVHKIGKKHHVTVATSDALVQMIIWGEGAVRMSAQGFLEAVNEAGRKMREEYPAGGGLSGRIEVPGAEQL